MIIPLLAAGIGAIVGAVLTLMGWYTGPAWSVYVQHVPLFYPLIGAVGGCCVGLGAAMWVVG